MALDAPDHSADSSFATALDNVRTRLLDLTLANRLIHFRHTKRSSLRVVDELPDVLFSRLRDGAELLFVSVPEPPHTTPAKRPAVRDHAESLGLATSFDLPEPPTDDAQRKPAHRDHKIQTLLYPSDLETCLRTLSSAARSALDETGTNMLHLVFGFLEWNEREHPDKKILAPLLTLPVSLRRGDVDPRSRTYRFHITHSGEDVAANLSLQEKMRRDFGIHMPPLEEEPEPETYFARVAEAVTPIEGWRVRRHVTLCLLSFGKLLMFRDLDPERWPESQGPLHHPRVRELFHGAERTPYDVSHEYRLDDATVVPDLPPIVLDADSSQHSALVDAIRGRNLVIQGPPGTGKSQTIANLIAAAMVRGKSVLFVAEKLAALEVVRRRLDDVGLGMFCVELHSHKTLKHRLLKDLGAKLEARGKFEDAPGLDDKMQLAMDTREELTAHAERLHAPLGKIGWSVFDVLWGRAIRASALGELSSKLCEISFPDPSEWSLAVLESTKTSVDAFAGHMSSIRAHYPRWMDHPWAGMSRPPEAEDERSVLALLAQPRR